MTTAQYSDIVQALGNVRANVMNKEMTDDGWDLRDELLALQQALALLARVVYEAKPEAAK